MEDGGRLNWTWSQVGDCFSNLTRKWITFSYLKLYCTDYQCHLFCHLVVLFYTWECSLYNCNRKCPCHDILGLFFGNVVFRVFFMLVIDDFVIYIMRNGPCMLVCPTALHKHQSWWSVPEFHSSRMAAQQDMWLDPHTRPKTHMSFPGQKHSKHIPEVHCLRGSISCVLRKELKSLYHNSLDTSNTVLFPVVYYVPFAILNLSH